MEGTGQDPEVEVPIEKRAGENNFRIYRNQIFIKTFLDQKIESIAHDRAVTREEGTPVMKGDVETEGKNRLEKAAHIQGLFHPNVDAIIVTKRVLKGSENAKGLHHQLKNQKRKNIVQKVGKNVLAH